MKIISKKNAKTFKKPTTIFVNFLIFSFSNFETDLTTPAIVPIITSRDNKMYRVTFCKKIYFFNHFHNNSYSKKSK